MTTAEHPGDDLQRLLDGRLNPERAAAVEAHVAGCARCRRELDAVRRVKTALRDHLPQVPVPDHVAARVRAVTGARLPGRAPRTWRGPAAAAAVLALAAVLVLVVTGRGDRMPDIVRTVASDFSAYRSDAVALQRPTGDPEELLAHFRDRNVTFATPVFLFDAMNYRLTGGSVLGPVGGTRALFAYESAGGDRMICEMYPGTTEALTSPAEVRTLDGIDFFVYRRGDLTLVFWQDGDVVCVLVADGDPEQAIVFARAKATGA